MAPEAVSEGGQGHDRRLPNPMALSLLWITLEDLQILRQTRGGQIPSSYIVFIASSDRNILGRELLPTPSQRNRRTVATLELKSRKCRSAPGPELTILD